MHDRPHASSTLEWWYLNAHLTLRGGRRLSVFVAFFRETVDPRRASGEHVHALVWALSDAERGRYVARSLVEPDSHRVALARIDAAVGFGDPRLDRALREVFTRGGTPRPDRTFARGVSIGTGDRLALDFAGDRLESLDDGGYRLVLSNPDEDVHCELVFAPEKPPIRHGDDGVVFGVRDEAMFYYFVPRCGVRGSVTLEGERHEVARGSGWYDREFGAPLERRGGPTDVPSGDQAVAWNWVSLQLDDGTDVSVYAQHLAATSKVLRVFTTVSEPDGRRVTCDDATLTPLESWQSVRSFVEYPVRWRLVVPSIALDVELRATMADQEVRTLIAWPAFWEGRVEAAGERRRRAIAGVGFVERSGFRFQDLDGFFAAVSRRVRAEVDAFASTTASPALLARIVGDREPGAPGLADVDVEETARALFAPVRDIVDRGGKAWRSCFLLLCLEAVGGDARGFAPWLALPELVHVGSLVMDDVEDRSTVRRGGPTAHLVHGEPLAINSGSAAYFVAELPLRQGALSDRARVRIYHEFFDAMRAGHVGQALDVMGLVDAAERAAKTGDASDLERRVLATHRFKTAVPAAGVARIGAIAGGAEPALVGAIGAYVESLGLAFQIIDDVLNLRGFRDDLKARGEDIAHGKITLPVAKALGRLGEADRRALCDAVLARSGDPRVVSAVIASIERCGALDACVTEARDLVERAWGQLDPHLEDSHAKLMLRIFGGYVLERHY